MFIELTDDETGKLHFFNIDSIRSVYESNTNKDNAVLIFRERSGMFTTTESYAEVVTLIRNATEPIEVTAVSKNYDWSTETGVEKDDIDKLPWEQ